MSWFTDVCSKAQNLDLPDLGDPIKDLAMGCGFDEATANKIAMAGCLAAGDLYGAAEHGIDVADDEGLTLDQRIEHGGIHGAAPYDLSDPAEWLQWMKDDPDACSDAYLEALFNGTLPEGFTDDMKQAMHMLMMKRNEEIAMRSSVMQACHDTAKEACNFRV